MADISRQIEVRVGCRCEGRVETFGMAIDAGISRSELRQAMKEIADELYDRIRLVEKRHTA